MTTPPPDLAAIRARFYAIGPGPFTANKEAICLAFSAVPALLAYIDALTAEHNADREVWEAAALESAEAEQKLETSLAEREAEVARLREALQWYVEPGQHEGDRARAALGITTPPDSGQGRGE